MAVTGSYKEKLWAHKDTVKRIVFEFTETPRKNATYTYDLSKAQNGSIMSYLYPDIEDSTKYIAYIQAEERIKANPDSSYLFSDFTSLEQIDNLNYLDTSDVTNMQFMFWNCSSLTSLDVSSFNTSNVTSINSMFFGCSGLTSLNLSNFDTSNVTDMNCLFQNCSSLTTLDLSNFNTSKVTVMNNTFSNCTKLTSLNIKNWDINKVTSYSNMFHNVLSTIQISVSDSTMQQWIIGVSTSPKLTTSNVIIG